MILLAIRPAGQRTDQRGTILLGVPVTAENVELPLAVCHDAVSEITASAAFLS